MAAPTSVAAVSQLVATTRDNFEVTALLDQVFKTKPALELFRKHVKAGSGEAMTGSVFAGTADTVVSDDAGTFSTARSGKVLTKYRYEFGQAVITPCRVNWRECEMNKGNKTKLADIALATAERAVEDHSDRLDSLVHGLDADQVASGVLGFEQLIGTGPLAGIDPAVAGNEFWKSTVETVSAADKTPRQAIRFVKNKISDASGGKAKVDVALCGTDFYDGYVDALDDATRIMLDANSHSLDTEWDEIKHGGLVLRRDPNMGANDVYLIDSSDLRAEHLEDNLLKDMGEQPITGTYETVRTWNSIIALGVRARNRHGKLTYTPATPTP